MTGKDIERQSQVGTRINQRIREARTTVKNGEDGQRGTRKRLPKDSKKLIKALGEHEDSMFRSS